MSAPKAIAEVAQWWLDNPKRKGGRKDVVAWTTAQGNRLGIPLVIEPWAKAFSPTTMPGSRALAITIENVVRPGVDCLYLSVRIPKGPKGPRPHAWISSILYDEGEAIPVSECAAAVGAPPGVRWGSELLGLAIAVARAFGADWIGLDDGSFVSKCGNPVSLTDYLHRRGALSFYERRGFMQIVKFGNFRKLGSNTPDVVARARAEVEAKHRDILAARKTCLDSKPTPCRGCGGWRCKGTGCSATVRTEGQHLTADMSANDARACKRFALEKTCLTPYSAAVHRKQTADDYSLVKFLDPLPASTPPPAAAPPRRHSPPRLRSRRRKSARAAAEAIRSQYENHEV